MDKQSDKKKPLVATIILNYNSRNATKACVRAVLKSEYKNLLIIVVDNASPASKEARLLEKSLKTYSPAIRFLPLPKNIGYAGGNNAGIRLAAKLGAHYTWLLNPDIQVSPNALSEMLAVFYEEKKRKIAAVGVRICLKDRKSFIYSDGGGISPELGYRPTGNRNYGCFVDELAKTQKPQCLEVDYVDGSCLLAPLEVWREIGLMIEDFFMYFEETQWALRAQAAAYVCLATQKAVVYNEESSRSFRYHFWIARNRIWLAKSLHDRVGEAIADSWSAWRQEFIYFFKKGELLKNRARLIGRFLGICRSLLPKKFSQAPRLC